MWRMRSLQNWGEEEGDSEREEKVGEGGIMGWCRESTHIAEKGNHPKPEGKGCCTGWGEGVLQRGQLTRNANVERTEESGLTQQPSAPAQPEGLAVAPLPQPALQMYLKMSLETGGLLSSALACLQRPFGQEISGVPTDQCSTRALGSGLEGASPAA